MPFIRVPFLFVTPFVSFLSLLYPTTLLNSLTVNVLDGTFSPLVDCAAQLPKLVYLGGDVMKTTVNDAQEERKVIKKKLENEKYRLLIERSARFKSCREAAQLLQIDVAKEMGVHSSQVDAWENHGRTPTPPRVYRLAELYNVTVAYLMYGDTNVPMPPHTPPDAFKNEGSLFRDCLFLHDRLDKLLQSNNIAPERLSLLLGLPEGALERYLQGHGSDVLSHVKMIADFLGVEAASLAFGDKK